MERPQNTPKMKRAAGRPFESLYSDALGREIVQRVRAGESLASVCRAAHMPTAKTVYNWREVEPEFAMALAWAQGQARRDRRAALTARRAAWAGRVKARACPGSVSGYSAARGEAICDALAAGLSLRAVCRQVAEAPSVGTVYNWLQAYPDFAQDYARAREVQQLMLGEQALDLVLGVLDAAAAEQVVACRVQASHLRPRVWDGA